MFRHFLHHVHYGNIYCILNDPLIQTSYYVLNKAELLEQFTACIQYLVTENIFFAVHPQIWESFLC